MTVAQNHRAPRTDIVQIAIAVDVFQPWPLAAVNHNRLAAHGTERSRRTVDSARHQLLCAVKYR